MSGASRLRALLRGEAMVIAPGAYDGLTAKLVAQAGFPAVYMTGAGTSVSHGYPDFGLLTMSEMVENAARIVRVGRCAGDRRCRYRLRQRAERVPHRAGIRAARRGRRSISRTRCRRRNAAISTTRRSCRARTTWRRSAPRSRREARSRLHDHRADRCARRRGVGRGDGARQCGAGGRRRHGVRRGAADHGGARCGAEAVAGPCLLNVVRGGKTPEIDLRRGAGDGLSGWRSCRGCC